jgi:histidinol dehydrogenase
MLKIIEGKDLLKNGVDKYLHRSKADYYDLKTYVEKILSDVKKNGDKAIIEYTEKFDGVNLNQIGIRVTEEDIKNSYEFVDKNLIAALKGSIKNIEKFHKAQLRDEWSIETVTGVKTGQILRPIESVGIYIPGGRAVYVSSVLMTCIPAVIAGVEKIIICSPPGNFEFGGKKYSGVHPAIIAAANECGVKEIYGVGSAWAIAAMAYGTETIPKVIKIIGPGNRYVNAAKILVKDTVSIDSPAGPSEIAIITDENANTDYITYDLLSQLEHDPDNVGVLISYSKTQIEEVMKKLNVRLKSVEKKEIIKKSLENYGLIIKTDNLEESIQIANEIAVEHLQILTDDPKKILPKIKNAGAIFLGEFSPVPLGDYCAGTNHVLPTGGAAKTFSGLNSLEFMKIISTLECTKEGLKKLEKLLSPIAEFEDLIGHRDAVKIRLKKN